MKCKIKYDSKIHHCAQNSCSSKQMGGRVPRLFVLFVPEVESGSAVDVLHGPQDQLWSGEWEAHPICGAERVLKAWKKNYHKKVSKT